MKKIICVCICLLLLLSACGWEVEIKEPEKEKPEVSSSESLSELISEEPVDEEFIEIEKLTGDMETIDAAGLIRYKVLYYNPFEFYEPDGSPEIEWTEGRCPRIYTYDPILCRYEVFEYAAGDVTASLNQLVKETISRMRTYIPEDSFDISVKYHKSMAVVDFNKTTDDFWERMDYEKSREGLLNSIGMTLLKSAGFEEVGFTADGGKQFKTANFELEADGYGRYIPRDLYAEISDEEYAKLRALCKYDESVEEKIQGDGAPGMSVVYDDAVTLRPRGLDVILTYAGYTGQFDSPKDIPDETKILAAFESGLFTNVSVEEENYSHGLEAISQAVNDDVFYTRENVERFIKFLFGPDAQVIHQHAGIYTYHAEVGVYTPKHIGGWAKDYPYVFSVEETEKGYEAEVAYINAGMGGFGNCEGAVWIGDYEDYEQPLEENEKAMDYLINEAPRFKVGFEKTDDGKLFMAYSKKIIPEMTEEQREIAAKYLAPIHYLAVNETWNDPDEISGKGYYFTYYSMRYGLVFGKGREARHYGIEEGNLPSDPDNNIPTEEFEGVLKKHFDGELSTLRRGYYDFENDCYHYPEYIGFGEAVFPVVTWAGETWDYYTIIYDVVSEYGGYIGTKELHIENHDSEEWKYAACY